MISERFTLNETDIKKVANNALIFAAPAILVLLASFRDIVPKDAAWGVVALFVVNVVTDLFRKWVAGK